MLLFVNYFVVSAQNKDWVINDVDRIKSEQILSRTNHPNFFKIFALNLVDFKAKLQNAPIRDYVNNESNVVISVPSPSGDLLDFEIFEQSDFEDGLAKKFPNFKSYVGHQVNNKATKIYFTINKLGFNAVITSPDFSTIYIDVYSKDLSQYIVYHRKDLENLKQFTCHTTDAEVAGPMLESSFGKITQRNSARIFREYRLAMACTIEYASFHINRAGAQNLDIDQKKQVVLSAMQVTVNRVNSLYERDMALRFNLVANNDLIIFIESDEFSNNNSRSLINESQTVIDNYILFDNYDIGHTVSTGGGGLAQLYSPCSVNKARGITGSSSPINDPYDIDYVSHEIGHQFGATHSYNNSCDGNRSSSSAYETGSGNTIMAYAGICAPNVQSYSDDHFHNYSIVQMSAFVASSGNCSVNRAITNTPPTISTIPSYTIPYGTPFKLTANATDAQNDALTYVWEQMDREITTQPPVATATSGPNFKSVRPSSSPTRYFPAFSSVLDGNLSPTWEVLPSVARPLNFAITVRDNNTAGAQTRIQNANVTVANTGPFRITSPVADNTIWDVNSQQTITWNVAGTTANGINVSSVNILLSLDGGETFTTIAAGTPNDGTEVVNIPNTPSTNARILIEANGNIFYTVSKRIVIGYNISQQEVCKDYTLNYNNLVLNQAAIYYVFNIDVPDNFVVNSTKLSTNITATRATDVRVLFKNNGETETYSNSVFSNINCSSNPSNLVATFQNSASAISCTNLNTSSTVAPMQSFTSNGLQANGTWSILVAKASNRSVSVNQLKLSLCGTETTYTLSTKTNEIADFKLYPNPNNGEFTLNFESKNDKVEVGVFDLNGRLILKNNFDNQAGTFNQNIKLNNLVKGIYLVKVKNGMYTKNEKVIIQ